MPIGIANPPADCPRPQRKPIPMEFTLNSTTVAVISTGVLILLAMISSHVALIFRVSKLPTREELHEVRNEARQENAALRAEFRQDMAALREEFRQEMANLREEMRQEFRREMAALREGMRQEFRREMAEMREGMRQEFRQDMDAMRQEFRRDMAELREDLLAAIRESEARIIRALVEHRHPTPDGPPTFAGPI